MVCTVIKNCILIFWKKHILMWEWSDTFSYIPFFMFPSFCSFWPHGSSIFVIWGQVWKTAHLENHTLSIGTAFRIGLVMETYLTQLHSKRWITPSQTGASAFFEKKSIGLLFRPKWQVNSDLLKTYVQCESLIRWWMTRSWRRWLYLVGNNPDLLISPMGILLGDKQLECWCWLSHQLAMWTWAGHTTSESNKFPRL